MGLVDLPSTLGSAYWDKQKSALAKLPKAPVTKLGDEIKLLAKLHVGVDWSAFGADKLERAEQARSRTPGCTRCTATNSKRSVRTSTARWSSRSRRASS